MGSRLIGIEEHLTLAREYALLGNYDSALIFFEGVLAQIIKHINDIEDPYLRTQWKHCKQNLTEEFHIVRLLDAERQAFRDVPSSPKYINNKNNSTAISPLRARPPSITNVNGDEGLYDIPGSSPFSRPIVCIDPFDVDDPDVWRPPRDNVPVQFASRRPTKAGQIAAAAQARRMAAYSRSVEVRGLGLANRNKQQHHAHAVPVHTANPVATTKSNNTNKCTTTTTTMNSLPNNNSRNNNTNSTNSKDSNNKCNSINTNSATATATTNNNSSNNKCATNNNSNSPSTNLNYVNTCSNNALQAMANLPMGQRLTSTCAQTLRKSLTRGPNLRGDNKNSFALPEEPEGPKGVPNRKGRYEGPDGELAAILEREVLETSPGVRWEHIAGLTDAKRLLEEVVVLPLWMPEYFQLQQEFLNLTNAHGLFSIHDVGKTLLAKAVATECGTTFFNISSATLASKWRGESERMVRCLFELARAYAPSTIFIDEIDSLCNARGAFGESESSRRVESELLVQVDGVNNIPNAEDGDKKLVMVLAATNFPWEIDDALRRRLEKRIYIPLPDEEGRRELICINLKDVEVAEDVDINELARCTEGYSGDDLTNICRDASMNGMRRKILGKTPDEIRSMKKDGMYEPVAKRDFQYSLAKICRSVSTADIERYERWLQEFGST